MSSDLYKFETHDALLTPNLLLYPDLVRENIRMTLKHCKPENLRPHVKTIKNKELIQMLQEEGVSKFKCATLAEAELLGACKAADVLLAYPMVGGNVVRYLEIIEQYPDTNFQVIVDSISVAEGVHLEAIKQNRQIQVFIDVNLGMNRTGVSLEEAPELVMQVSMLGSLKIVGLHGYDGHLQDTDVAIRFKQTKEKLDKVLVLYKKLEEVLHCKLKLVLGGSNTFPIYRDYPFIESSPGTFMLWDWGYHTTLKEQEYYHCAAVLGTRVISKPTPTTLCFDLGHKAIAAENSIDKRIHFVDHGDWKALSQSEEHLVVEVPSTDWKAVNVGDFHFAIPYHICPTVAKYPAYQVVCDGKLTGKWTIIPRY